MRPNSFLKCALFLWTLFFMPLAGLGADGTDMVPTEVQIEIDLDALQDFINENLPADFEPPTQEDWESFWGELTALLSGESLENLASFKPTGDIALTCLAAIPGSRDEQDWLRQRIDLLDMADLVVRETPVVPPAPAPDGDPIPTPPPPPPRQTVLRPSIAPPMAKAATTVPVPAPLKQRRIGMARSDKRWVKKLAGRPLPANAQELIPRLKAVFKAEGVPTELVWVAEAESSFNPEARSPSGAVGLFQFMPATAERFGLRTTFYDERKDPDKSAQAAARYLKILYRQMGSWDLALASYNAGEGRVKRLLEKRNARSFEGIADYLPLETQMYVPKVMAIIAMRENVDPAMLPAPAAD